MTAWLAVACVLLAKGDNGPFGGPFGDNDDIEITFIGPDSNGPKKIGMNDFGNSLPLLDLMNSPMQRVAPRETGLGPMMMMGGPMGGSDPMVDPFLMEMLARMGLNLPGGPKVHDACQEDVKKWCVGDQIPRGSSVLHCLSTHATEISNQCFEKIKGTLPHVCHDEIQDLCGQLLDDGILACLEKQLPKLKGRCLDAYVTARHHIDAATSSTSITASDKKSGQSWSFFRAGAESFQKWTDSLKTNAAFANTQSSSFVPVVCVMMVFGGLYWMSQDGNRQMVLSAAHSVTSYKFETIQAKPRTTADAAYGATLTI